MRKYFKALAYSEEVVKSRYGTTQKQAGLCCGCFMSAMTFCITIVGLLSSHLCTSCDMTRSAWQRTEPQP